MADSAVVVTAGTGTNIDTRTEATNGHHRQVVVLGDPATNDGVAPVDATAGLKVNLGADNDVTVTGTVDLGATDNAVLDAIEADTTTLAGAVSGTEMQVDVLTMPTVTVNSHAVTNAGTFAVQVDGAALTSLQLADDVVATLGTTTYTEAATKGSIIGAVRRDADTTLVDTTNEVAPLQVDARGALKVEAFSGETLPVSLTSTTVTGTVAVTQSGTWDEVGINDSGNSITVDAPVGTPAFVRLSDGAAAISTLPVSFTGSTDVATQTTLAALNTKVTAVNTGAVVVASGAITETNSGAIKTSVELIDDTVFTDDTSTHATGTTKGLGIMAVAAPTDAAVDANDIGMVAMTTARALKHDLTTIAGTAAVSGSGTATGALRVELANNGTGVVGLNAGTNAIGKLAANSGVDIGDVDVTSIAAGTNKIGQVSVAPQTANGLSVFNGTSSDGGTALTSTAQVIKASAGQVYGWYVYNPNATAQFVQLYNTAAASVTVGTTNPLFMLTIPATSAANVEFTNGITFSNAGFSCAATSTAGGSGAPSTALDAVIFYK